jgi:hypothetical protein
VNRSNLFAARLSFFAADRAIEFADAIRAKFHNAALHAVLFNGWQVPDRSNARLMRH